MKVLQIIDTFGMGGAETWLIELLRLWKRYGPDAPRCDFLMTSGNVGIFDAEAQALGASIFYLRYGRSSLSSFTRGFRELLKAGNYAVLHDHQAYASGWHYLLGRRFLPPLRITHVHNPSYQIRNNYGVTSRRRLAAWSGMKLVQHYATHVAGTSRQILSEYGFDASAFRRIPKGALHCGFDLARFRGDAVASKASVCREFGWPDDSRIILFGGRIDQSAEVGHPQNHKNSAFAAAVGIACARRDARVRMLFAGAPSPAVAILERRIADAGLTGRIVFAGIRTDIERLMGGSDVLLFPSRGEGLGMAAVEAQAAGLPVLASTAVPRECVVIPELVRFHALDAGVDRWAEDALQLLEQPRDVSSANQRVARSPFAIENSADALLRLYTEGTLG